MRHDKRAIPKEVQFKPVISMLDLKRTQAKAGVRSLAPASPANHHIFFSRHAVDAGALTLPDRGPRRIALVWLAGDGLQLKELFPFLTWCLCFLS